MSGARTATPAARSGVTAAGLADVAAAQLALVAALLRTRLRPTGRLVRPHPAGGADTSQGAGEAEGHRSPSSAAAVGRAVRAVDRASRRGLFRPTCLVRSLALVALLERYGVHGASMRIGVRRPVGERGPARDRVDAHAWVEVDGVPVGEDAAHLARFTPIGALTSALPR